MANITAIRAEDERHMVFSRKNRLLAYWLRYQDDMKKLADDTNKNQSNGRKRKEIYRKPDNISNTDQSISCGVFDGEGLHGGEIC